MDVKPLNILYTCIYMSLGVWCMKKWSVSLCVWHFDIFFSFWETLRDCCWHLPRWWWINPHHSREINLWSIKKFWISDLLYIHIEILETDIRSINARLSLIPKSQILMLNQMWFNWFFLVLYQRGLGWGIKIVPWLFSSSLLDYNLAQYVKITLVEFLIHEVFFYYLFIILVLW